MAFMGAAMLTALAPIQLFPKALALMGAGILALTRPLQLLKLALLGTGIGAILVGIGTAAVFLANNAKGITAFFSSMTTALKEGLQGDRFKFMVEGLERIGNLWKSITGEIATSNWEAWGSSTGASLAQSINSIADALDRVIASWEKLQSIWNSTVGFVTNTDDVCTTAPVLTFSNYQSNLSVGETCVRDSGSPQRMVAAGEVDAAGKGAHRQAARLACRQAQLGAGLLHGFQKVEHVGRAGAGQRRHRVQVGFLAHPQRAPGGREQRLHLGTLGCADGRRGVQAGDALADQRRRVGHAAHHALAAGGAHDRVALGADQVLQG